MATSTLHANDNVAWSSPLQLAGAVDAAFDVKVLADASGGFCGRKLHEGRITSVDTSGPVLSFSFEFDERVLARMQELTAAVGNRLTVAQPIPSLDLLTPGSFVVVKDHWNNWFRGKVLQTDVAQQLVQVFAFDVDHTLKGVSAANLRIPPMTELEQLFQEPPLHAYVGILQLARAPQSGWPPKAIQFLAAQICSTDVLMEIVGWTDSAPIVEFYRRWDVSLSKALSSFLIAEGLALPAANETLALQSQLADALTASQKFQSALQKQKLVEAKLQRDIRWLESDRNCQNRQIGVLQGEIARKNAQLAARKADMNPASTASVAAVGDLMESSASASKDECSVCLEPYASGKVKEALIRCGHCYCSVCIVGIKQRQPVSPKCPVCKAVFAESMRIFD